jgi:hypothetical protein
MSINLFTCTGGTIMLPNKDSVLISREDGGNLVVNPPRAVWERGELSPDELTAWALLVAAAGRAMLETLPQLEGGCINYWEAGNWALNDHADPAGVRKTPREYRSVHLHLLGRNPGSSNPRTKWGESPIFPAYADRLTWARGYERLTPAECQMIVRTLNHILKITYALPHSDISAHSTCDQCNYPFAYRAGAAESSCSECSANGIQ